MAKVIRTALACLLIITLTACNSYGDYPEKIIGTWENTEVPSRTEIYVFGADGQGSYAIAQDGKTVLSVDFEYSIKENKLIQRTGTDEVKLTVSFDEGRLVIKQGKSSQSFEKKS